MEEIRYRKSSLEQYRDQITSRIHQSVLSFHTMQHLGWEKTQHELDNYIQRVNQTYVEVLQLLKKQKDSFTEELNFNYVRPFQIDQSLEDFQRFYNESLFQSLASKLLPSDHIPPRLYEFGPLGIQLELLNKKLATSWEGLVQQSQSSRGDAERAVIATLRDLQKLQDDLQNKANKLEATTRELFPQTLSKEDLRKSREAIEKQMKKLEREGSLWIDDRFQALNATIKNLQDKVHMSESLFDEIVGKRRASLHYAIMNDITLKKVLTMMDANDAGWKLIKSEDGYEVYRKFMGAGLGSQFACVKAYGVIRAPPKKVLELFEDNTRVREYNTLFEKGRDIEVVGENTKVVWAASSPIFPFKPRDFCTVVHIRQLKDGTFVVLNRATKHPDVPVLPNYVRGSIVLGANIIQPIPGKSNMCRLTMITQVDPGGFAPPMIINHLCSLGPIGFLRNIQSAVLSKPSKKVLEEKRRLKEAQQKSKTVQQRR
eukprot:gene263-282_t